MTYDSVKTSQRQANRSQRLIDLIQTGHAKVLTPQEFCIGRTGQIPNRTKIQLGETLSRTNG